MLLARDEQGHLVLADLGDEARRVGARALLLALPALLDQVVAVQDLHDRVVLVDQLTLGRLAHQFVQHWIKDGCCGDHQIAHGRGGDGRAEVFQEIREAGVGQSRAEAHIPDHGRDRRIEGLPGAILPREVRRKDLVAGTAAQDFPLDDLGGNGGHRHDPSHDGGSARRMEVSIEALGAAASGLEGGVGYFDPFG